MSANKHGRIDRRCHHRAPNEFLRWLATIESIAGEGSVFSMIQRKEIMKIFLAIASLALVMGSAQAVAPSASDCCGGGSCCFAQSSCCMH